MKLNEHVPNQKFVVHKTSLGNPGSVKIFTALLPAAISFIRVGMQENELCVWYVRRVETPFPDKHYTFTILGTGFEFEEDVGNYLGTVDQKGYAMTYVWHVFVREPGNGTGVASDQV